MELLVDLPGFYPGPLAWGNLTTRYLMTYETELVKLLW
jgi:hypothetical protein